MHAPADVTAETVTGMVDSSAATAGADQSQVKTIGVAGVAGDAPASVAGGVDVFDFLPETAVGIPGTGCQAQDS